MHITSIIIGLFAPLVVYAQPADDALLNIRMDRSASYVAEVVSITEKEKTPLQTIERSVQYATVRIINGSEEGKEFVIENTILENRPDMVLHEGEKVVVEAWATLDGGTEYFLREKYRLPSLIWLAVIFLFLAAVFGGRMGLQSAGGLFVSILILALFVVPKIIAGGNPLFVSFLGAFGIAFTSLYLAHGFNRRTTIALVSTMITLFIAALLAIIFVYAAKLFGLGSEEAMYLQSGPTAGINLRGLLLGGIIIGTLGILDDITTAQTAVIDELHHVNANLGFRGLYRSGISIGREHIASLVNSLALAYVGASMPLLLLFSTNRSLPVWVIINGEFIAEEVVRTLVGSATLLFAVPISTVLAAWLIPKLRMQPVDALRHRHRH